MHRRTHLGLEEAELKMADVARRSRGITLERMAVVIAIGAVFFALSAQAGAQEPRAFQPLPRGEIYEEQFVTDFWDALGYKPDGLTRIEESETLRLLVTGGSQAVRGDADAAIRTFDLLPENVAAAFPFLATMHEDLLVPDILGQWYTNDDARTKLFAFYQDTWLPHPEYRDDFVTFRDDTMGRASRIDQSVPAVWIMGNLPIYGFVPDQALTKDDPYLFLWGLLTDLTYYAQRAGYYGLQWDRYNPNNYKRAAAAKVGEIIKAAHDEAARREASSGYWSQLLDRYNPLEAPTQGVQATGEQPTPPVIPAQSREQTPPATGPASQQPVQTAPEVHEPAHPELFQVPGVSEEQKAREIETLIRQLESEAGAAPTVETPSPAETPPAEATPSEEATPPEQAPPTVEQPVTEQPTPTEEAPSETPNEFQIPTEERTPSEAAPEAAPPGELGNYATSRLGEIADDLMDKVGTLATELGQETIDLVVLYNDVNVSQDTISNAESRYVAKRQAFLAGLAVWDRFNMEIYSPLTLADFDSLVITDLRAPYEDLKASATQWAQYSAFEDRFEQAFGQIQNGVRNRRDDTKVVEAENAALMVYLPDYNDMIKEIEDLLSGAVTSAPGQ